MKEQEVKKRGWVKTAAIVFLAIMVILQFFSNTIMNRSLPEVATQHVESRSITTRVRGRGPIEANESFDVVSSQARTVNEVRVRLGDEVEAGDVLLVFDGRGSEELDRAEEELHELELQLERMLIDTQLDGDYSRENRAIQNIRNRLSDAQNALNTVPSQGALDVAQTAVTNWINYVEERQVIVDNAFIAVGDAQAALDLLSPEDDYYEYAQAEIELERARSALEIAQTALDNAEIARDQAIADRDSLSTQINDRAALEQAVRDIQRELDNAIFELSLQQREGEIVTSNIEIDLRELKRQIEEKRDEIEELQEMGDYTEITSRVNGIVTSVNIIAGNVAEAEAPLMVIEVVDRGYSVSFSVGVEQASRLVIGDSAEVDWGFHRPNDDTRAVLRGIRNDPQNPATNRIITFDVAGSDIESGVQLNLNIGQRSENYSVVVPNSAIRTDTNGDFVLTIEAQTSPLGNRYIATRAEVIILAQDDTHSAVTGAVHQGNLVIMTSSMPVEPGMQVRLAG